MKKPDPRHPRKDRNPAAAPTAFLVIPVAPAIAPTAFTVIPAKAGIQSNDSPFIILTALGVCCCRLRRFVSNELFFYWIPAFAGMTWGSAGMTGGSAGMTGGSAGMTGATEGVQP